MGTLEFGRFPNFPNLSQWKTPLFIWVFYCFHNSTNYFNPIRMPKLFSGWAFSATKTLVAGRNEKNEKSRWWLDRLQVVSNFGDGDWGAGEIHMRRTRNFEEMRRDAKFLALPSRRVFSKFRARVCILPTPQLPSPKLQSSRSLTVGKWIRKPVKFPCTRHMSSLKTQLLTSCLKFTLLKWILTSILH